ncbi:MAG: inosine monophosphate cyclohydrolase [Clostridiales bacterium]|nr:inosine monophosphate cyclohydrolase [Clostridiales bacterium]
MSVKGLNEIKDLLSANSYPGRGIIVGKSADGKSAMIAYFIMGRSTNSRNRIFERYEGGMRTKAFDESKLVDPSLIIYNPFLECGNADIVTNGDQTDTVRDYIVKNGDDGYAFEKSLHTREFEPDHPNYTPRISGILNYDYKAQNFNYKLSILKSSDGNPEVCDRYFYSYLPIAGLGHFIHTYECDGNPIPSFYGEPERVKMPNTAKELADIVWTYLNEDNKVSLFVRTVSLADGKTEEIIINKNK